MLEASNAVFQSHPKQKPTAMFRLLSSLVYKALVGKCHTKWIRFLKTADASEWANTKLRTIIAYIFHDTNQNLWVFQHSRLSLVLFNVKASINIFSFCNRYVILTFYKLPNLFLFCIVISEALFSKSIQMISFLQISDDHG